MYDFTDGESEEQRGNVVNCEIFVARFCEFGRESLPPNVHVMDPVSADLCNI